MQPIDRALLHEAGSQLADMGVKGRGALFLGARRAFSLPSRHGAAYRTSPPALYSTDSVSSTARGEPQAAKRPEEGTVDLAVATQVRDRWRTGLVGDGEGIDDPPDHAARLVEPRVVLLAAFPPE